MFGLLDTPVEHERRLVYDNAHDVLRRTTAGLHTKWCKRAVLKRSTSYPVKAGLGEGKETASERPLDKIVNM